MALDASAAYPSIKAAHGSLPAFSPLIPTSALPAIAFFALCAAFALTFTLTTLPKNALPAEFVTALAAAFLAGGGAVALFCTVGVYV